MSKRGPRTLVCYICGREFGTASLKIHQPQCAKKFLAQEALKPPNERRPLPEPPKDIPYREKANKVALKDFYDKVLVPCQWCGRTFLEDRLAIHNKSCTQEHPAKRITDGAKPREGTKVFGEFHPNTGSDPSPTPPKSTSSAHNSVSGIKPVKTKITKPETTNAFATPTNESTVQKRASSPSIASNATVNDQVVVLLQKKLKELRDDFESRFKELEDMINTLAENNGSNDDEVLEL